MPANEKPDGLNHKLFGENFSWGVSASAYQTEGAYDADGKGLSIWDVFSERKGKIKNHENAKTACDFYHRYEEDISIIKSLNIPNFRFSVAWSRILPQGIGSINQKGIDFYMRVIDSCLEKNIEPWLTLYNFCSCRLAKHCMMYSRKKMPEPFFARCMNAEEISGTCYNHRLIQHHPIFHFVFECLYAHIYIF